MNNLDPEKQEKLKECLKEERRMKEEEAKKEAKKNEEFAALKRAASFQYGQPRVKMTRANAPCRSCHQMGHWATDPGIYKKFFFSLPFLELKFDFYLECPLKGQNVVIKQAPIANQATGGAPDGSQDQK